MGHWATSTRHAYGDVGIRHRPERGPAAHRRRSELSPRERSIVELVAQGLDNHQIAGQFFLGEGTVRNRVSEILAKSGAGNRTRLAVLWLSHSRGDR